MSCCNIRSWSSITKSRTSRNQKESPEEQNCTKQASAPLPCTIFLSLSVSEALLVVVVSCPRPARLEDLLFLLHSRVGVLSRVPLRSSEPRCVPTAHLSLCVGIAPARSTRGCSIASLPFCLYRLSSPSNSCSYLHSHIAPVMACLSSTHTPSLFLLDAD